MLLSKCCGMGTCFLDWGEGFFVVFRVWQDEGLSEYVRGFKPIVVQAINGYHEDSPIGKNLDYKTVGFFSSLIRGGRSAVSVALALRANGRVRRESLLTPLPILPRRFYTRCRPYVRTLTASLFFHPCELTNYS